jgi:hypothetical protein
MPQKNRWFKALMLLSLVMFLLVVHAASLHSIPLAGAVSSYTGAAKPMEFHLHYLDIPVDVAGIQTKYVIDTTRSFSFQTQQEAHANSFYKPVGQPKIAVDFYLYPNFAARVTIDGSWQVLLWINGSAYKPTGFTLNFKEVSIGGATLWDSGFINPRVTSSIGEYIDVPVYNYNLSTTLTHTFTVQSTLQVHIEVNAGSSADTRIWFDSQFYPSKAILPAKDYARPVTLETYAYDNTKTNLFYYNWSLNQRIVNVRVNVTDPFGGYDINTVKMTILDPSGNPVVNDLDMDRQLYTQWQTSFAHIFEAKWAYPATSQLGNYTLTVSVIDNNGYYRGQPFVEQNTHIFSVGLLVYYNPAFLVVDDGGEPLPKAQVFITWPNGTMDALPRVTSANGFVNLTHVLAANYSLTILWKDEVVKKAIVYVNSDGPYNIQTEVYQLAVTILGNNAAPIHGAYVIVYTESGLGYGLDTTDELGRAVFKLPRGTYSVEAYLTAEYWLRIVTTSASKQNISVHASTSETVTLADFPSPIWTTTGFWLLIASTLISVIAAVFIIILLRKRLHAARAK